MTDFRTVEPNIGFWKKGDDFKMCLNEANGDVAKAFSLYADFCRDNASVLQKIADKLKNFENVSADGDTHTIQITLKKEDAKKLVEESFAYFDPADDEDDNETEAESII